MYFFNCCYFSVNRWDCCIGNFITCFCQHFIDSFSVNEHKYIKSTHECFQILKYFLFHICVFPNFLIINIVVIYILRNIFCEFVYFLILKFKIWSCHNDVAQLFYVDQIAFQKSSLSSTTYCHSPSSLPK